MTIISQPFHTARAIYIGDILNIDLIAYEAADVKWYRSLRIYIREALSRTKVGINMIIGYSQENLCSKSK